MNPEKAFLEGKEHPKKWQEVNFIELKSDYGQDLVKAIKTHFTQPLKGEKH